MVYRKNKQWSEMALPGVYTIKCEPTGWIYCGSSGNIRKRWMDHQSFLRTGKHSSRQMVEDYQRHGIGAFSIRCVYKEESPQKRLHMETRLLKRLLKSAKCYNKVLTKGHWGTNIEASQHLTREQVIRIAKHRHPGANWITAFAAEIGVSYWTVYRLANNAEAKVSELVKMKVEKVLSEGMEAGHVV